MSSRSSDKIRLAQRHEHIRELMVSKVEKRLKGRNLDANARDFIRQEVELMLARGENSEAALAQIASSVKEVLGPRSASEAPSSQSSATQGHSHQHQQQQQRLAAKSLHEASKMADREIRANPPRATPPLEESILRQAQQNREGGASPTSSMKRCLPPQETHKDDLWAKLADRDVQAFHHDILAQKREQRRKAQEQSAFLESQVAKKQQEKKRRVEDEKKYIVEEERQKRLHEEEERRQAERKMARFAEEKKSRDEQLEVARRRRLEEQALRKQEEELAAERAKIEYEKEQIAIQEKKVKAKQEQAKAMQFNEVFQTRKAEQIEKERELDKMHQRMFLERLARQEAQREEALAKMQEKQKKQQTFASRLQDTLESKAAEDEKKAQAYLEREEAKRRDEERRAKEKAAAEKTKIKQYLNLQILDREAKHAKEVEALQAQREEAIRAAQEAERVEQEKRLRAKLQAQKHKEELEKQVEYTSVARKTVWMSDQERRLNQNLLAKALDE